ncbi:MAG: aminoacyl-tRNA hydrolase [Burkholderiales bacterium]
MKLVVGLGNPGGKYERTRHNAGFWWLDDCLAGAERVAFRRESRFQGSVAKVSTGGGDLWLLKPETFMNNSGQAVAALANYYKIGANDILVAHDELDLPPGGVKLKFGGGLSGHNGLKSIAANLGTQDFWRLRIGIGHPRDNAASEQEVVNYVLHPPGAEEQNSIKDAMARAMQVWPQIIANQMEAAMLTLHTR